MSKNILLIALAASMILPLSASADQSDCDTPNALHCAYVTGLPSKLSDGRYLKAVAPETTVTFCVNNRTSSELLPEDAVGHTGKEIVEYFICNDAAGNDCVAIGQDEFTVTQNGTQYSIDPKYYNINFSQIDINKFASCSPSK